jgi:hypothetical protein
MLNAKTVETAAEMRVKTWQGLQPISDFDEVEIHEMVEDPEEPGALLQKVCDEDCDHTAYTVFLHLHEGGIETVQDFWFDPSEPGAAEEAKAEADMLGTQLVDMLSVSGMLRSIRENLAATNK